MVVTLLAILAGIVSALSVIHALLGPGILPFFSGPFQARDFDQGLGLRRHGLLVGDQTAVEGTIPVVA